MITINLLPESHRPPKAGPIQQFHRSPMALMLAAALVGLAVLLAAWAGINKARVSRANQKLQTLAAKKGAIDELKTSVALLQRQAKALEETHLQRSAWASRLNAIADVTPQGVWFTDLVLDAKKFVLQGAVVRQRGEEMNALNRLAQDLKQDPRLAPVVSDVQLGEIRNVQDGEIDLMEFTMTCRLTSPPEDGKKKEGRKKP